MGNTLTQEKLISTLNNFEFVSKNDLSRVILHAEKYLKTSIMITSSKDQNLLMYLCNHIFYLKFDYMKILFEPLLKDRPLISQCDILGKNIMFYILNRPITNVSIYNYIFYVVNSLIENGIDINKKDLYGRNVLFYFIDHPHCDEKYLELLSYLLENGIDINDTDVEGETAISKIIYKQHKHIFKTFSLFLNYGFLINTYNTKKETLLLKVATLSMFKPNLDIFYTLLNLGCDANIKTIAGNNSLMWFIKQIKLGGSENINVFKTLIRYSDINTTNLRGETALILAGQLTNFGDYMKFVEILIYDGADAHITDNYNKTYFDYVKKSKPKIYNKNIYLELRNSLNSQLVCEIECIICNEPLTVMHSIIPCGHSNFCSKCFNKFKNCPNCRGDIISSYIFNIVS